MLHACSFGITISVLKLQVYASNYKAIRPQLNRPSGGCLFRVTKKSVFFSTIRNGPGVFHYNYAQPITRTSEKTHLFSSSAVLLCCIFALPEEWTVFYSGQKGDSDSAHYTKGLYGSPLSNESMQIRGAKGSRKYKPLLV